MGPPAGHNDLTVISKDIQTRLWGYIAAICKNNAMAVFAVGGMGDHIHILFRLPPSLSLVEGGDAYQIQFVKMDEGD
ncbi:MAG TPA: transposase [Candidatus Angelobacter sp.]|nr:transposase [Candidatus Angelobacter sp.]